MLTHKPNTSVPVNFTLDDSNNYTSGILQVLDENDVELTSYTLSSSDYENTSFSYIVDKTYNNIGDSNIGLRTIFLVLKDEDDIEYDHFVSYYLSTPFTLEVGINSLVTYSQALIMVPSLTKLEGWHSADKNSQVAALSESYDALCDFVLHSGFKRHDSIGGYTKEELESLSTEVFKNFKTAQLLHANYLLGGEVEKSFRDSGVMSHSVGESTTFFRTSKPLDYGISSRAYQRISKYLDKTVKIANA